MRINQYRLPRLRYSYGAFGPFFSEGQIQAHHAQVHKNDICRISEIFSEIEKARRGKKKSEEPVEPSIFQELSEKISSHTLHCYFWDSITPAIGQRNRNDFQIMRGIKEAFGSFENLEKKFFSESARIKDGGWLILAVDKDTRSLVFLRQEDNSLDFSAQADALLVFDFWGHSFEIDYKKNRRRYAKNIWRFANWEKAEKKYTQICC